MYQTITHGEMAEMPRRLLHRCRIHMRKVGRNDPCPCGAMKQDGTPVKYKHCHGKQS